MTQLHRYTVSYRLSASEFDDQTVLKEPEQKKALCPKVQIIWLIDPEKIGGTEFFYLCLCHEVSVRVRIKALIRHF